ncbi:MAG: prenyltransferase, partial [Spirochaetota bacterium]
VHGATNLINDYFDVRHNVDRPDSPTAQYREHFLLKGTLTSRQIVLFSLILYALAALIAVYFTLLRGLIVPILAIVGGLASLFYTADPVKYKHHALGEVSVFLMWGPLMTLGSCFVVSGTFSRVVPVILVSIPQGLWVALVIFANNMKDIGYDDEVKVTTLATLLKREGSIKLFIGLIILIYLISAAEIAAGVIPVWGLIVFLTLPLVIKLVLLLKKGETVPPDADPRTAQVGMLFGLLLIVSFVIDKVV